MYGDNNRMWLKRSGCVDSVNSESVTQSDISITCLIIIKLFIKLTILSIENILSVHAHTDAPIHMSTLTLHTNGQQIEPRNG